MAELEDPADIDVLYWVGCAGSYDERNQSVSRAFAGLMKQAGVRFAMLGNEETCTGDPARRLGNEYLYATVAAQNVETLNRYKPKRIVTQCPHCYHNLKKEYPGLRRAAIEVIARGRIYRRVDRGRAAQAASRRSTERDHLSRPCFMARHDRKWNGARAALGAIPGAEVTDVEQSKNRTFCCGAGGGCFWKEEHEGTAHQRRSASISSTRPSPKPIAVGCPFCMTMMTDAVKVAIAGRNDGRARPVRTGRRIHRRPGEVMGASRTDCRFSLPAARGKLAHKRRRYPTREAHRGFSQG